MAARKRRNYFLKINNANSRPQLPHLLFRINAPHARLTGISIYISFRQGPRTKTALLSLSLRLTVLIIKDVFNQALFILQKKTPNVPKNCCCAALCDASLKQLKEQDMGVGHRPALCARFVAGRRKRSRSLTSNTEMSSFL